MRDGNSSGPGGPGSGPGGSDASEPASVHVIVENGRTRIVLSGEIDADLAADLADATADAEAAALPIDIDAQHVTFMDSSGIAFLARVATRVQQPVRVLRAPGVGALPAPGHPDPRAPRGGARRAGRRQRRSRSSVT